MSSHVTWKPCCAAALKRGAGPGVATPPGGAARPGNSDNPKGIQDMAEIKPNDPQANNPQQAAEAARNRGRAAISEGVAATVAAGHSATQGAEHAADNGTEALRQ